MKFKPPFINLLFLVFLFSGCQNKPEKIDWETFENEVIPNNNIIRLIIYDEKEMYVFINVHPGPYKNKKRVADYCLEVNGIGQTEQKLAKLSEINNKSLMPHYSESENIFYNFLWTFGPLILLIILYSIFLFPIIQIIKSENKTPEQKFIWISIILLAPIVGLILYFAFGKNQKN